ncbi:kinase-like protein [Laetiporus sulphureus 93-53]|uniref:non-specific serine/threonine protein kinase n=1 Tax=Laetiporus sulphureus 93-53 TaxID=1314785 RepID=A0A165CY04_9APHY|nr:kinase-like protein [Laetiporus sulphureus 93-53]KZT03711.1 kinase-like protein [Laetiporus sulphureus 93-53]
MSTTTQLSVYWNADDNVEDIRRYTAGGFHPIRLGDVVSPPLSSSESSPAGQYRILHKLGDGAFATVWLAEVLHVPSQRYVVLKICAAEADAWHELDIYNRIPSGDEMQNVLRLRDSFSLHGPNGVHTVLVHDVLGNLLNAVDAPGARKHARMLCCQIACGLAALHRHGIVHGDLHSGNVSIALPTLDEHPPQSIMDHFGNPECTIVLPTAPPTHPEALPPYLVHPISIFHYLVRKDPVFADTPFRAVIMDLGNAIAVDEETRPSSTPAAVCAPELMFERVVRSVRPSPTRASDIWSFACTMYELVFGSRLFHFASPDDALLGAMATLCGEVPLGWQSYWESHEWLGSLDISCKATDAEWARRLKDCVRDARETHTQAEVEEFFALLRSMLQIEPERRLTNLVNPGLVFGTPNPSYTSSASWSSPVSSLVDEELYPSDAEESHSSQVAASWVEKRSDDAHTDGAASQKYSSIPSSSMESSIERPSNWSAASENEETASSSSSLIDFPIERPSDHASVDEALSEDHTPNPSTEIDSSDQEPDEHSDIAETSSDETRSAFDVQFSCVWEGPVWRSDAESTYSDVIVQAQEAWVSWWCTSAVPSHGAVETSPLGHMDRST